MYDAKWIFREWYTASWRPWFPTDFRWRQFRFMCFDGKWIKFPKPRTRIRFKSKLIQIIKTTVPKHAYYTALKFLDPSTFGPKDINVPCLGGDLVFDVDILNNPTNISIKGYKQAINIIFRLKDTLNEMGFKKMFYVFTGFKGFQLHVLDFDPYEFIKEDKTQTVRLKAEEKARKLITDLIISKGIPIDAQVTRDIKRIVRLPNTLHGKTSLKSFILNNHELNEISEDPLKLKEKAVPKPFKPIVKIRLSRVSVKNINFFDEKYSLCEGTNKLPLVVVLILMLNKFGSVLIESRIIPEY